MKWSQLLSRSKTQESFGDDPAAVYWIMYLGWMQNPLTASVSVIDEERSRGDSVKSGWELK